MGVFSLANDFDIVNTEGTRGELGGDAWRYKESGLCGLPIGEALYIGSMIGFQGDD